jgi:hypothetical protein
MKCWKSAFNAQGSRLIIVALQVGAVKIYAARVEALKKKGKTGWNSVHHKNWDPPTLECECFLFFWISPYLWSNSGF